MRSRTLAPWLGPLGVVPAGFLWAAPGSQPQDWRAWEAHRATLAEIVIHVQPVFDLANPSEDTWLGRTANHLHLATREAVVRRALLFQQGDQVLARDIYETERLLRALAFIKDARIQPEPLGDGRVRAHVWVRDAWTIMVDAGFQQVGGQRSMHFGIQDQNFLGSGRTVGINFDRNHERTDTHLSYRDPQLFASRWQLDLAFQRLSDGYGRKILLQRPFFAMSTPWSAGIEAQTRRSTLTIYDQGKAIFETPTWAHELRIGPAWAIKRQEDRVWRAGVVFRTEDRSYGAWSVLDPLSVEPAPALASRRQRGPAVTVSYLGDAYRSFHNMKGMDTPEDYNLTWEGSLELGSYTRRLGSTRPGPYLRLNLSHAWSGSPSRLTLFQGHLQARSGAVSQGSLRVGARVSSYFQMTPVHHLAGYLDTGLVRNPEPEQVDYLGAAEGLRGYPNFLHPGDGHWLVSLEERYFTQQRWWGLFRLGYVAFLDAGAIRRLGGSGWSPIYPDAGVGVRLGDLKSSLAQVLLFSVAVPLVRQPGQARYQLGISSTVRF